MRDPANVVTVAEPSRIYAACCVLLVSPLAEKAWIACLQQAADHAGKILVRHRAGESLYLEYPGDTIVVVTESDALNELGVRYFAVIMSGLAAEAEAAARDPWLDVVQVSRAAVVSGLLPGERTAFFLERNAREAQDQFVCFEGVVVAVPSEAIRAAQAANEGRGAGPLAIYVDGPVPELGARAHWNADVFVYGKGSSAQLPSELDLTGIPRLLVSGPHIYVPPGIWQITARFSVDTEAAGHRYRLEWGDLDSFTSFDFQPTSPGVYEATIKHEWTAVTFAELRFVLMESALGGALVFIEAEIERIG